MANSFIADNPIALLKSMRWNNIIFGAFLILQGIVLYATLGGSGYNVFVVIGTLMAIVVTGETVIRIFKQKKTLLNILLCALLTFVLFAVVIILIGMIAIPEVREKILILSASLVAILNGSVNIIESIKIEKNKGIRALIIAISVICIGFGVAYWATYERAPEMLVRARGIVFILTGLTDVWLGLRAKDTSK